MRIGFLTANGTSGIDGLLQDGRRGELYEIGCVVGCRTAVRSAERIEAANVPLILRPFDEIPCNLRERERHDREMAELLLSLGIDTVFAAGYPYVMTEPMLDAYPERIFALHDGDLTERDDEGQRRWVGAHAVLDAILGGAAATRSSLYLLTRDVGHGPLVAVGPRHAVAPLVAEAACRGDYQTVRTYARLHREWMRQGWSTLLPRAVELLVGGTLQVVGDMVWIDGAPGACRLGEPPDACAELGERIRREIPASCPFLQP